MNDFYLCAIRKFSGGKRIFNVTVFFAIVAQMSMFLWIFQRNIFSKPALDFGGDTLGITYLEYFSSILYFSYFNPLQDLNIVDFSTLICYWINWLSAIAFLGMPTLLIFFKQMRELLLIRVAIFIMLIYLAPFNFEFCKGIISFYGLTLRGCILTCVFALHHLTLLAAIIFVRKKFKTHDMGTDKNGT